MRRTLKRFDLTIAEKPVEKLGIMLTEVKDRAPKEKQTGIVFKIPCGDFHVQYIYILVKRAEHWKLKSG